MNRSITVLLKMISGILIISPSVSSSTLPLAAAAAPVPVPGENPHPRLLPWKPATGQCNHHRVVAAQNDVNPDDLQQSHPELRIVCPVKHWYRLSVQVNVRIV